jgi:hypothetical protein
MKNDLLRGTVVPKWFALALFAVACIASRSHGQSPRAVGTATPAALQALGDRINKTLTQPKYAGLDKLQRTTAATLAISAAMIVDGGRCSDRSAPGSAAETLLSTFDGMGRRVHQPIFDLPESSKTSLIDFAMDVESQRQPAQDLTSVVCHDQILPEATTEPLSERRAAARQVLALALSPPRPGASESQH